MRTTVVVSLILLFSCSCFASVIHECASETIIHEVITQPTYKKPGKVVIILNDSIRGCLCNELSSDDTEEIAIDVQWEGSKNYAAVFPNNKIKVISQCGSTMGSDGQAKAFNVWYLQNIID